MIRIKPWTDVILPGLFTKITGFVYEKNVILPGLFTKIWPLLTYSNRNITVPWVRLSLPHGREEIPSFLFCVASCLTEYRGRL